MVSLEVIMQFYSPPFQWIIIKYSFDDSLSQCFFPIRHSIAVGLLGPSQPPQWSFNLELGPSVIKDRGIDIRANNALETCFPELVHVNFSMIVSKILGLCLLCSVVQLANFSMDHVIDALAANVIITRAQTIDRARNFEGLVNMVQEGSAIDWLKAFTRVVI